MRDWKEIRKKLIFPPMWLIILLPIITTVALVEIFVNGWDMSPLAYVIYVLSFYTLAVICIACWKILPHYYKAVRSKLQENKYIDRYMTDAVFKSNVGLYRSLAINLIYVVVNAVSGYVYQTYWFGIFAGQQFDTGCISSKTCIFFNDRSCDAVCQAQQTGNNNADNCKNNNRFENIIPCRIVFHII